VTSASDCRPRSRERLQPEPEHAEPFDLAQLPREYTAWLDESEGPVDEKSFFAAVAERAALSKEEVADLTRATLEELAGQISGGELQQLAVALPDWLEQHLPRHNGRAHPKPWADFVRNLSQRTGLTEIETERGVRAVMTVLREAMDPRHLEHALSQLPMDYRRPEAA
jgi:uncharacterized protein (DUF2267 family)